MKHSEPPHYLPEQQAALDKADQYLQTRARDAAVSAFRQLLETQLDALYQQFSVTSNVERLLNARADLIDAVLKKLWQHYFTDIPNIALIAVGGYGRRELHPYSDIDILLLCNKDSKARIQNTLGDFIAFAWDLRLDIGHSLRSPQECAVDASKDVTIVTNLMESRLLVGDPSLFSAMNTAIAESKIWSKEDFFKAKLAEQENRHQKHDETPYRLEPNIKEGPGGLRDIQMITWVTKRYFSADDFQGLISLGFITETEAESLIEGRDLLWRIRFALHQLAGKREDRLLFGHQTELAQQFNYQDEAGSLAVELFMQHYFRTVTQLERLNEMLLQLLHENIEYNHCAPSVTVIDDNFQSFHGYLEVRHPDAFQQNPSLLLKLFLVLMQQEKPKGVRANTIRLINQNQYLINDAFRAAPENRALFKRMLQSRTGIYREFMRMNRYGILAAYLPEFKNIVGRMQFDLFHIYTVDVHTLFVLRNIRRFRSQQYQDLHPHCAEIFPTLDKPYILYIAALYHDIAKGRGGDHSQLGAQDVMAFCRRHDIDDDSAQTIQWLVLNHLLMSITAQRKDINDPDIIQAFAKKVGSIDTLKYLYLLTIADISATNPQLWTSWKGQLLLTLYQSTLSALQQAPDKQPERSQRLLEIQETAKALLHQKDFSPDEYRALWDSLNDDYFLNHSSEEIAWHSQAVLTNTHPTDAVIDIKKEAQRGCSAIFIYAADSDGFFAVTTMTLSRLKLNIVDARIATTKDSFTMDTYRVVDHNHQPLLRDDDIAAVKQHLQDAISHPERLAHLQKRTYTLPRQLRHFNRNTDIEFAQHNKQRHTIMSLRTLDKPGLLETVATVFMHHHIRLNYAKISTVGEVAEDTFMITDATRHPITNQQELTKLRQAILTALNELS